MNKFNFFVIFASFVIVILFGSAVFINLNIKNSKTEVERLNDEINDIKQEIKRQKIEISSLVSPVLVIDYIKKNDLKAVKLKNVTYIYVEK
ncbi:MAG: hypothetical protein A2086_09790 [Spirochaetes bacterium GWD1_27_9]|nr:MAG: hypothetical protein A2Z98_08555 [Spirochaetes bacterium GWB1_27_13]OHD42027.1 MAG: hypothetical protein A2086_09790 [Spirochaetes bacterium GWD1_27_9]